MRVFERVKELALIMIIAWISMIIMLIIIDRFIVPITLMKKGYMMLLFESLLKITLSSIIAAGWLYLWRNLVKRYIKKFGGN
ncbi:MAG: hypothetical protein NDF56_06985 [archaeon GB-1845-036]|nr:hypothetical protein [Candidatus Culexmicrobium thermophilum]HDO20711.1 hypothetical protein [Candidatus Bathyarchaeota archaeon]